MTTPDSYGTEPLALVEWTFTGLTATGRTDHYLWTIMALGGTVPALTPTLVRAIADLPGLLAIAKEYACFNVLDDAHGFGVLGRQGRGTCDHFGLTADVDIICGSMSKALASTGGYVAGDRALIDGLLVNGSWKLVGWISGRVRQLQSGFLYHYALAMILGIFVLMTYFVWLNK